MELLWLIFDLVGTIAFAVSGTLVGIGRRMDIFGMLVLALATAIGGGIMRDLIVGNIPPNSLRTGVYVTIVIAVTFIIFLVYRLRRNHYIGTRWVRQMYLAADTLGLASFTVTGAGIGMYNYPDMPVLSVILAQRVPSVLREEVYALPAIIGGIVYCAFYHWGMWQIASYSSFIIVVVIRTLAIRYNWSLPRIK